MPPIFSNPVFKPDSVISINVVEEFGAAGDNITDNSPAIELALTELKRRLDTQPARAVQGELYFPNSTLPYRISRPIVLDRPRIGIVGENRNVTIDNTLSFNGPTVIMGMRMSEQNSQGATINASSYYRPDLYGDLDTSLVTASGQKWGFRTNNSATLIFDGTPADLGPPLGGYVRSYTAIDSGFLLDIAIKHSGGTPFYAGTTAGIINVGNGTDTVFSLNRGGITNQFDYSMYFSDGTYISSSFNPGATASGVFKLAVQVDLINRRIQAYYNGNQIAISSGGTFFSGSGYVTMIDNKYYSMIIGTNTNYVDTYGTAVGSYNQVGMDFTLCALSLSSALIYKNNGVGNSQQRNNNGTVNDSNRYYYGDSANTKRFFYLNLLDDPSSPYTLRFMSAYSHGFTGQAKGFLIENSMYTLLGGILHNYISNITINGTSMNPAISIGQVLDPYFEHVIFGAGTVGFNVLNLGANYTLRLNDCQFGGHVHNMKLSTSIAEIDNATFGSVNRSAIKTVGSNINLKKMFVAFGSDYTNYLYESYGQTYGGFNSLQDIVSDFEGTYYKRGVFYVEQYPTYIAPATYYSIKNVYCGTVGTGHVINAVQKYAYDNINYMVLDIDNVQTTDTDYKSYLNINGNAIFGTVKNISPDIGCPMTHTGQFTTDCNVQIEHRNYKNLPRKNNWVNNGHILFAQSPKEGQFSEFRCVKTGRVNTNDPPRFVGINPLISRPNVLVNYGYTHAYTAMTLAQSGIGQTPSNNQ